MSKLSDAVAKLQSVDVQVLAQLKALTDQVASLQASLDAANANSADADKAATDISTEADNLASALPTVPSGS